MTVGTGRLARRARAIVEAWLSPSSRARGLALCVYYVAVLIALLLIYGTNPPNPPPFIYQGF
jgi:hypothetical protein